MTLRRRVYGRPQSAQHAQIIIEACPRRRTLPRRRARRVWLRWHAAQLVEKGLGVLIGWCQLLALFVEVPLFRQRQLAGAMVDMEVRVRRGPEFLLAWRHRL